MAQYKHLEIPGNFERYVKDKKQSANAYYRYFLARLTRMFEYKRLPDTIPHEIFDRYLFNNGISLTTKVNDKLYTFYGNAGGPQDVYYRPCQFIVANPHIQVDGVDFTANVTIFPNSRYPELGQPTGVLMRNDTEWIGLAPLISRYSYLMAENVLTLRTADVMLRIVALLTAPSDKERAAALEYLKTIEAGGLSAIGESAFFDGIKLQSPPSNNGSYLTQFIEYQQYLKGSFFNEIGLSANYNMKREAIGKGESTLDTDALLPLADDMLLCRKQDLQKVNEMFGTDIEVSFSSAWLQNQIEAMATLNSMMGAGSTPLLPSTSAIGDSGSTQGNSDDDKDTVGADVENEENGEKEEETIEQSGAKGANGAEEPNDVPVETESDEESDNIDEQNSSEDNESVINDVTWDETLQAAKENIEEKIAEGGETINVVSMGNETTEDDAGDNPAD